MAKLRVEREIYESKEKEYYGYFVGGKVRGREVKVDLMPKNKDFDGYELLDIIFDIPTPPVLDVRQEEQVTADGAKTRYTVYEIQNTDEDGILYAYKVKPRAESDKSVLNVLLQQAEKAEERAKQQAEEHASKDGKEVKT